MMKNHENMHAALPFLIRTRKLILCKLAYPGMVSSVGYVYGERLEEVWRHAQPESVVREHQSGVRRDGELCCARLHKVGVAANRLSGLRIKTIKR